MGSPMTSEISGENERQDNKPLLNEYFSRKLSNGKILVTTRHGSWSILSGDQYDTLHTGEFQKDKILCHELMEKGIILDENSIPKIINAFRENYHCLLNPRPLCIIYLTSRCNLGCKYCLAGSRKDGEDLSREMMESIITFIAKMPHSHIALEFQGGETLLRFDLLKDFLKNFDEKMKTSGKTVESRVIVSNLTLMNEEIAGFILKNDIGLCTSLDGPKDLHDSQRRFLDGSGSYDTVLKWISFFSKKGRHIGFLPTITIGTLAYDPKSLVDEHRKAGADHIFFRPVYPLGRAQSSTFTPTPEAYFEFWRKAVDYMVDLSMDGHVFYDNAVRNMLVSILTARRPDMCMRRPCGAGINHLAFYLDGSIYSCDLGKKVDAFRLGNILQSSYEDIFLNTLHLRATSQESQPLCDTCAYGSFCGSCPCKSYARFGKIVPVTPQDFDCKVNRMMLDYIFEKMEDPIYRAVFDMWVRLKA